MFLKDTCAQNQWLTILLSLYVTCRFCMIILSYFNSGTISSTIACAEEVKSLSQEWIMLQNEEDISLFTVVQLHILPDIEPFVITRSLVLSKFLSCKLFVHGSCYHLSALSCIDEVLNLNFLRNSREFYVTVRHAQGTQI